MRLSVVVLASVRAQRDFYYSKLREVEVLCQSHEGEQIPFLDKVPIDYD